MIHIKEDTEQTLCGIVGHLPEGHVYFFGGSVGALSATCLACKKEFIPRGTPISQLSSRPGTVGFERFKDIAETWGYD